MNTNPPSVDQFLAQSEPDEDDTPDPMERVATALEDIVNHFTADKQQPSTIEDFERESTRLIESGAEEALRLSNELLDDLEAKHQTVLQVISDVEAALGKSKAAPALAARAVIDAWRNPTVPETEEPEEGDPALTGDAVYDSNGLLPPDPELSNPVEPDSAEGHTRTPHPEGPDFCRECSGALQEWIVWPCPTVSGDAQPLATGPEEGHEEVPQPEHSAPVEEWRAYARALGYAGPEIDKANRSMIRTTLGIAQVS